MTTLRQRVTIGVKMLTLDHSFYGGSPTDSPTRAPSRHFQVYLAGPFTSQTEPVASANELGDGVVHIISEDAPWRSTLLATEAALNRMGWSVFLPHRDVSMWGHRQISPPMVVEECIEAVLKSDLVVALLAESFGTHVEVGAALGRGIPTIVINSCDARQSYFGGGIAASELVTEIVIPTITSLVKAVEGPEFAKVVAELGVQKP
jgi:hypothetical protein